MRKKDELATPTSCLNKAKDDELLFVLLGRDQAAPSVIEFWVFRRVALGLNKLDDPQIKEALACAASMAKERETPTLDVTSMGGAGSKIYMVEPSGTPGSL